MVFFTTSIDPISNLSSNPQELLDQLAASCQVSRTAPNSLLSSVDILSHLGHIQFTWPGFLNYVKVAAGKSGTEESKLVAKEWITARIASDPAGARFILSHAARLAAILARHPFEYACKYRIFPLKHADQTVLAPRLKRYLFLTLR